MRKKKCYHVHATTEIIIRESQHNLKISTQKGMLIFFISSSKRSSVWSTVVQVSKSSLQSLQFITYIHIGTT